MPCQLTEVVGNLFSASSEYSLAHSIGADLRIVGSIALEFRNRFGRIDQLKEQNTLPGGVAVLQDQQRFIYYLVTKERSHDIPSHNNLYRALEAMGTHMRDNGVNKLAIPRVACGLDRLNWFVVKGHIMEIFANDNVEIVVYQFTEELISNGF